MEIITQKTRTLVTRDNGRSADGISPNFIYGCLGGCMKTYCYVARFNDSKVYKNSNQDQIFQSIDNWVKEKPWPKVPNQTDEDFYTVDIGCSTDVALHSSNYNFKSVFDFFGAHPKLKSTFATKYPNKFPAHMYNLASNKHRIRVSLMPQMYSTVLEPYTENIALRIARIPWLMKHMEVHINFSPVIFTEGWRKEYIKLFQTLHDSAIDLPAEVIFLTYNDDQAGKQQNIEVKHLLYPRHLQEVKDSQYAPGNLRYKASLKAELIKEFIDMYSIYFKSPIRYIF